MRKRDILVLKGATFRLSSNNFQIAKSLPMAEGTHDLAVKLPCFQLFSLFLFL